MTAKPVVPQASPPSKPQARPNVLCHTGVQGLAQTRMSADSAASAFFYALTTLAPFFGAFRQQLLVDNGFAIESR